jgi:hypothetical protein
VKPISFTLPSLKSHQNYALKLKMSRGRHNDPWRRSLAPATEERESAEDSDITFDVKSWSAHKAQIEFYSESRSHAWPGDGTAYDLFDFDTHSYHLSCKPGEKICYGVWSLGGSEYWGRRVAAATMVVSLVVGCATVVRHPSLSSEVERHRCEAGPVC